MIQKFVAGGLLYRVKSDRRYWNSHSFLSWEMQWKACQQKIPRYSIKIIHLFRIKHPTSRFSFFDTVGNCSPIVLWSTATSTNNRLVGDVFYYVLFFIPLAIVVQLPSVTLHIINLPLATVGHRWPPLAPLANGLYPRR